MLYFALRNMAFLVCFFTIFVSTICGCWMIFWLARVHELVSNVFILSEGFVRTETTEKLLIGIWH